MIHFEDDATLAPSPPDTMTAMIDVVLSLLAFMMLMINTPQLSMEVNLPHINEPKVQASSDEKSINLVILAASGQWSLDDNLINSGAQLQAQLQEKVVDAKTPVATLLSIDKETAAQRMIETFDILNRLGINNAQIVLATKGNAPL